MNTGMHRQELFEKVRIDLLRHFQMLIDSYWDVEVNGVKVSDTGVAELVATAAVQDVIDLLQRYFDDDVVKRYGLFATCSERLRQAQKLLFPYS